jgi:diadenylate cyclase
MANEEKESPDIKDIKELKELDIPQGIMEEEKEKKNIKVIQQKLVSTTKAPEIADVLKFVSFGTHLRTAIEKIAHAGTGALLVVGNEDILKIIRGGFSIDCKFTSNRVAELSKMDGAIILDSKMSRILYSSALMVPDPDIKTSETGSSHQAAERTAKQTGQLAIAVSQRTGLKTIYYGNSKYQLKELETLLSRTRSTLENLRKYKQVVDELLAKLNFLEIMGFAEIYDITILLQRIEIITRIEREIRRQLIELGKEAGLLEMEFKELIKDIEKDYMLIIRDYKKKISTKSIRKYLSNFSYDSLLDPKSISVALGYSSLNEKVSPKGYRFLSKIKSLSPAKTEILIKKFNLKELFDISLDDFVEQSGIDKKEAYVILEEIKKLKNELIAKL